MLGGGGRAQCGGGVSPSDPLPITASSGCRPAQSCPLPLSLISSCRKCLWRTPRCAPPSHPPRNAMHTPTPLHPTGGWGSPVGMTASARATCEGWGGGGIALCPPTHCPIELHGLGTNCAGEGRIGAGGQQHLDTILFSPPPPVHTLHFEAQSYSPRCWGGLGAGGAGRGFPSPMGAHCLTQRPPPTSPPQPTLRAQPLQGLR